AEAGDVDTVLIEGRVVLRDGQLVAMNERAVIDAAQREAREIVGRAFGWSRRKTSAENSRTSSISFKQNARTGESRFGLQELAYSNPLDAESASFELLFSLIKARTQQHDTSNPQRVRGPRLVPGDRNDAIACHEARLQPIGVYNKCVVSDKRAGALEVQT